MSHRFTTKGLVEYETKDGEIIVWADEIMDDYHTMHELYQHRMALNKALFSAYLKLIDSSRLDAPNDVFKSLSHSDGTMFEGYFIVMAITNQGQISYHYQLKHWDEFDLPVWDKCPPYDGHTSADVIERLMKL